MGMKVKPSPSCLQKYHVSKAFNGPQSSQGLALIHVHLGGSMPKPGSILELETLNGSNLGSECQAQHLGLFIMSLYPLHMLNNVAYKPVQYMRTFMQKQ